MNLVTLWLCISLTGNEPHQRYDGGVYPALEYKLSDIGELTMYGRNEQELTPIAVWRADEEVWETSEPPYEHFPKVEVILCSGQNSRKK